MPKSSNKLTISKPYRHNEQIKVDANLMLGGYAFKAVVTDDPDYIYQMRKDIDALMEKLDHA